MIGASALEGVRILDFSRAVAGPTGTLLLGDMGAEIINIEEVPSEEPSGSPVEEVVPDEQIAHFWGLNRNKKGVCIDMKNESGKAVCYDLVSKVDVVFDNFRPGVLQRLGIDYETSRGQTLRELSLSKEAVVKGFQVYRDGESKLVGSMALTGMIIVFSSLIIVSFLISLLRHLHIFDRRASDSTKVKSADSMVGTITTTGDMSQHAIAAVVAAIFLHEEEVATENKLLLTWKRASTNLWKASRAMPNDTFYNAKRGR